MKVLLDTHLLLWAASGSNQLSAAARSWLEHPKNELIFSPASLWEVSIKRSLGRADFHVDPRLLRRGLLDNGYRELPITSVHTIEVDTLPPLHKDPFDRILIAQSIVEGMMLLTSDAIVARHPGPVQLV
jgi:PIN domain nuclease of toxin-antitoxin system